MDFSNPPVIVTNVLNEREISDEFFDQGSELSDAPDKEGELEGHEQDWQLNDGLQLLKGLPILAIDEHEIECLDSPSVEEM